MTTNSKTPIYYKNTLKELDQKYYLILNEYSQIYPKSKTYSKIPAYKKSLEEDTSNLQDLQNDFFLLRNELENEIENMSKEINKTDKMITKLDKDNEKLNSSLSGLEQASDSAVGMFNDSQLLYNNYLLGNCYLLMGIVGASILMYKSK